MLPPGPKGNRFFGPLVTSSRRDPLNFMTRLAGEYGDLCCFRIGFERIFFVNHPDYVRDVFVNHYESFLKGGGNGRAKRFLGEGVLLSEGDVHRRQRRLDQQAFHRQRLGAYALEMSACAERCSARWHDGQTLDIWPEMLRLTLGIVGKTLFSADVESKDDEVGQAMKAAASRYRAFKLPFAKLLERIPLLRMRWFHHGKERLQRVVLEIIEERRASGVDHGDLLSMLLLAEDEDTDGQRMTRAQVWDEALTIFIAGYDTMATALMWTFYLLSEHPEAEAKLHAELDEVLADSHPATFQDLRRLPYTERVLAEAMRLYPPAWRLMRRATKDFKVGEYVIPARSLVMVCQYAMHRNPSFFPDPERFDPERFTPEAKAARPQYSYFPFGGGPRRCIGEGFALMEGVLLLATLARRWRLRHVAGHTVEVFPEHLLRAKHGMLMKLEKR
jgi:cytochrome P450